MSPAAPRDAAIECFFSPRSVAIVGASADPRKWGWMAAEQALRDAAGRHSVHLVNARGGEILGQACVRSVAELPDRLDLAVITLPPAAFESTIDALVDKGTKAIVAITAGFGESGDAGRATERRIVERVRAAGAAMVGPNCMGVFDGHGPFRCMPWAEIAPGPVGFISQSGGLIMDLSLRLADVGLGLSRTVSIGNQADVGIVEFVRNLGRHAATRVLAIYGESFIGGREVFREIERVVAAGKPVVVLSPDATAGAHRAARSHTASIVTHRRVVEAAVRDAGAVYARSLHEMSEALQALASGQCGRGRRVFVLTDTGGPGVLLAGAVEQAGLALPEPSPALKRRVEDLLTPRAVVGNPIDLVDNLNVEPAVEVLRELLASDECDAVLANLHAFVHDTPEVEAEMGHRLAQVARDAGKPLVVSCRSLTIPGVRALQATGMPVARDGDAAARMLALLCTQAAAAPRGVVPWQPGPTAREPITAADYLAAQGLFTRAGIELAAAKPASTLAQALAVARQVGYPVVLKALGLDHKSAAGGVALWVEGDLQLEVEWQAMSREHPGRLLTVEPLIDLPGGRELLIGLRQDTDMGPVLVLGAGGVDAETVQDSTLLLGPAQPADVEQALRRLRCAPRLFGRDGRASFAVAAVAGVAMTLCELAQAHPELATLEINPLLVNATRAVAVDARITLREEA